MVEYFEHFKAFSFPVPLAFFSSLQKVGHPTAGETVAWISIIIKAHRTLTQELLNKILCAKLKVYKHMESFLCNKRDIHFAFSQTVNPPSSISTSGALGALHVSVISMVTNDPPTTQDPLTTSPVPRN